MAFRHEVLHIRRQKQRLIDIPGAKILAHSPSLNQTRSELNSDYSDRLLEAGKPSCQLGRSLLVAKALGLDLAILASDACSQSATAPELPEVAEEEEPDGYSIRIL